MTHFALRTILGVKLLGICVGFFFAVVVLRVNGERWLRGLGGVSFLKERKKHLLGSHFTLLPPRTF